MRPIRIYFIIAAGATSAALAYLGTGLNPIWWALWLAPIPVLVAAPQMRPGTAFLLAMTAWFAGELNQWSYFVRGLELPLPLIIAAFALPAMVFGLGVLFWRTFLLRGSLLRAAFAFPVLWVTYEYLTEFRSPHSTFGNLGYSQMNCLPLIQIASITGIWGIGFVVFLFAAAIAVLLTGVGATGPRRTLAIIVGVVLCAVFLFGKWRLGSTTSTQSVAVTLLAKDVPMSVYLGSEEQAISLLREYAAQVHDTTPPGTEVVVLPEKIGRVTERPLVELDRLFSAAAASVNSGVVLGVVQRTTTGGFNSARFYSAEGRLEGNYNKVHLLPRVEPEQAGYERVILNHASERWGLQICKDMDFPGLSREYASDRVSLLLVPAWDFGLDRWLHARMAVLRGVENGFAVARSARYGLLTLSDSRGRILAETATLPDQFVTLTGHVPLTRDRTFYAQTGDWFAWACVAGFALLLVFLGRRFLE